MGVAILLTNETFLGRIYRQKCVTISFAFSVVNLKNLGFVTLLLMKIFNVRVRSTLDHLTIQYLR